VADSYNYFVTSGWLRLDNNGYSWLEPAPEPMTPDRQLAFEALQRQQEKELAMRARADKRAERLFKRHLTPIQRKQWKREDAFGVIGSDGGRYIIDGDAADTFHLGANGVASHRCLVSIDDIPLHDELLAKKWMLEANAVNFRRRAIRNVREVWLHPELRSRIRRLTDEVMAERAALG
jgi:hypothetical protein